MSTRDEEVAAIQRAGQFLTALMTDYPRIPKEARDTARNILRHFPGPTGIELFWNKSSEKK